MSQKLQQLRSGLQRMPTKLQQVPASKDPSSWRAGMTKTSERGYGWAWQKARADYLARPENVCCRRCKEKGLTSLARVVDHVEPHRGDPVKFWDEKNWQPLCTPCHDIDKKREEAGRGG